MDGHGLGMVVGIGVGLIAAYVILTILMKKQVMDFTFDERQERARGAAFKYAFLTLVVALMVYGCSEMLLGRWCDVLTGCMLCICVALLVFATVCIRRDAYLSLREQPGRVIKLFVALAAVNLGFGAMALADEGLVEDGVLTFRAVNPMVGALLLVILVIYVVDLKTRSGDEEAE